MIPFCDSRLTGVSLRLVAEMTSRRLADETARAAGLPPDLPEAGPMFIPYAVVAKWAELAARRLGERDFGAVMGGRHRYADLGAYARYVQEAPTLLRALARARSALPLIANASRVVARRTGDHLVIGFRPGIDGAEGARHVDESLPPLLIDLVRSFRGPDWRPDWIALPGRWWPSDSTLADAYGGPELRPFMAAGIAVPLADLAAPSPASPPARAALTLRDLPALAPGRAPGSCGEAVRQAIRLGLLTGDATAEAVALRLDVGLRTLQRRLGAEGLSFRELRLEEVLGRGLALLREGDAGIDEIARALGYDEPRSFRRAFRARFGRSPSQVRAEARGHRDPARERREGRGGSA